MKYTKLQIPDVVLIEPQFIGDNRGFFMETFRADHFCEQVIKAIFVQDNHSKSKKGTLRGLHYQICQPQGKLVRVILGEVFDVSVDLRKSSPYFGQWVGQVLSKENKKMLWVPPGFAHGFYVLSESAEFVYKCTDYYAPQYEKSVRWNDPAIGIEWPIPDGRTPILSDKDKKGCLLENAETYP